MSIIRTLRLALISQLFTIWGWAERDKKIILFLFFSADIKKWERINILDNGLAVLSPPSLSPIEFWLSQPGLSSLPWEHLTLQQIGVRYSHQSGERMSTCCKLSTTEPNSILSVKLKLISAYIAAVSRAVKQERQFMILCRYQTENSLRCKSALFRFVRQCKSNQNAF